ncbi:uncharacterized protein LOC132611114 [Lycium barbarum]|uniref:uncharacterized protein LOC132611114 n=1 Tax=Lycium barbarum TaxID=112863 RepID=UPI00293EE088|nr:uncharacterized protein LOC132611114 [Lycium barbarum]
MGLLENKDTLDPIGGWYEYLGAQRWMTGVFRGSKVNGGEQEIIRDINKPQEEGNVVIKLDMAMVYDRVVWPYLCGLMKKMGFSETWVDLIYRHISNNLYSLIVNGQRHGFFRAENGLRQGDPISPSLLVLSAELLSVMLNNLLEKKRYTGFYMNRFGPQVTHLAFADDMILFVSGHKRSIKMVMRTLARYEITSGQKVNKDKSCFMLATNAPPRLKNKIARYSGMQHKEFLVKYLGCPLIVGRQKIAYYSDIISKVTSGAQFRQLKDVSAAFSVKSWWNLRTGNSLWKEFMMAKYFRNKHPIIAKWRKGHSICWKELCNLRSEVEESMLWIPSEGNNSFWYDNRTNHGALYHYLEEDYQPRDILLQYVLVNGIWQQEVFELELPEDIQEILVQQQLILKQEVQDRAIWKLNKNCFFTVASVWDLLRQKKEVSDINAKVWHKIIPFKQAFITWRALINRLPLDANITIFGHELEVKCHCCFPPVLELESVEHLFCSGTFAQNIWSKFGGLFRVQTRGMQLRQLLLQWWSHKTWNMIATSMVKALPTLIMWELWRSRCASRYGSERPSGQRSEFLILQALIGITEQKFGKIRLQPTWEFMQHLIDKPMTHKSVKIVKWGRPPTHWQKINTDGSCKEGYCETGGIIRDSEGKMIIAFSIYIGAGTNN